MYVDQRKERVELLKDLLANGAGIKPLPVLKQVLFGKLLMFKSQFNEFIASLMLLV